MTSSESIPFNREGMTVGLYSAIIHAQILNERGAIERAYETFPDTTLHWCFIDLVSSSNFRISRGSRAGYARARTFFAIVRTIISYCPDIRLVKEIGDAVFLCGDFRQLLECMLLIDNEAVQLRLLTGDEEYPFAIRGGISFGPAKKLLHEEEDFVGTAIDQLARVMGERHSTHNLFVHESCKPQDQVLGDYAPFLTVHPPEMLSAKASKGMAKPVYYHWLQVDRPIFAEFDRFFVHWRQAVERQRGIAGTAETAP